MATETPRRETPSEYEKRIARNKRRQELRKQQAEAALKAGTPETPIEPPKPVKPKNVIGRYIPPDLFNLLEVAPANPTVRALVQSRIGQPIPDELTDYPAIKCWLEQAELASPKPVELKVVLNASRFVIGDVEVKTYETAQNQTVRLAEGKIVTAAQGARGDKHSFMRLVYSALQSEAKKVCVFAPSFKKSEILGVHTPGSTYETPTLDFNESVYDEAERILAFAEPALHAQIYGAPMAAPHVTLQWTELLQTDPRPGPARF